MPRRIWITWENQRRNLTLSKALGAQLFQFDLTLNRSMRYFAALFKTLITLVREKPRLVFVQNPSLALALFGVLYGKCFEVLVVVDAHNAGLFPFGGQKKWANTIASYIVKNAPLTIVTNENLKRFVEEKGGRAVVLPDPLPEWDGSLKATCLRGQYNVLFICTYTQDEPYIEVIKAARELGGNIVIYMTGNSKGKEKEFLDILPENVLMTGFLPEADYIQLLHSVDIVIDLTTRENCLVCGAYEAVSAGKPLIVSDTEVLREYFHKGTLYTDNTFKDLAEKIDRAISSQEHLIREIQELKKEKLDDWTKRKSMFEKLLQQIEKRGFKTDPIG